MELAVSPHSIFPLPASTTIIQFKFNNKVYETDIKVTSQVRTIFEGVIKFYHKKCFQVSEGQYPVLEITHLNFNETVLNNILDFYSTGKLAWPQNYGCLTDLIVITKFYRIPLLARYVNILAIDTLACEEFHLENVEEQLDYDEQMDLAFLQGNITKLDALIDNITQHLPLDCLELGRFLSFRQAFVVARILKRLKTMVIIPSNFIAGIIKEYISLAIGWQVYELIRIIEDSELRKLIYTLVHQAVEEEVQYKRAIIPVKPKFGQANVRPPKLTEPITDLTPLFYIDYFVRQETLSYTISSDSSYAKLCLVDREDPFLLDLISHFEKKYPGKVFGCEELERAIIDFIRLALSSTKIIYERVLDPDVVEDMAALNILLNCLMDTLKIHFPQDVIESLIKNQKEKNCFELLTPAGFRRNFILEAKECLPLRKIVEYTPVKFPEGPQYPKFDIKIKNIVFIEP